MEQINYYAIIPAEVRYANIPANAKLLYGEITALANKEGYCWASNTYFAGLYQVSNRSISQWISLLEQLGVIQVEISKEEGNQRKIYIGTLKKVVTKTSIGIEKKFHRVRKKSSIPIEENFQHNNTSNNTNIKKELSNDNSKKSLCFSNGFFDLFWMNYPRKVGKAKAIQIFEKLTDSEIHEAIDGCKRRAKKWMYEKTEERYIPHPATWLNQKRRQDEINIQPATIQGTGIVIINKT